MYLKVTEKVSYFMFFLNSYDFYVCDLTVNLLMIGTRRRLLDILYVPTIIISDQLSIKYQGTAEKLFILVVTGCQTFAGYDGQTNLPAVCSPSHTDGLIGIKW